MLQICITILLRVFLSVKIYDHVIHSLKWWKSRNNQGECDFIIFHPDRGFIALEVKGGRITLDNFQWHSIDRNGCQHKIDNPISQVKNAMHAIIKIYQSKYGKFNGYFCWGVCFPDCIWDVKTDILETSKDNILDCSGLLSINSWVDKLFKLVNWKADSKLNKIDTDQFIDMLNPQICLNYSIYRILLEQEEKLQQFNRIQDYLIDLFEDKKRVGFQGAAGTGKTWIAIKKALKLADQEKRVLVMCFNKEVNQFMYNKLREKQNITVKTFHAFLYNIFTKMISSIIDDSFKVKNFVMLANELLLENTKIYQNLDELMSNFHGFLYGFEILDKKKDYQAVIDKQINMLPCSLLDSISLLVSGVGTPEDFYSDRLPLALLNLLENVKNDPYYYSLYRELNYDAVIIDEGQDFNKNWCDCIQLLFEKPRNRIFYAFFDENQNIFQKYKELPIIKLITSGNPNQHIFRLTDNLRNTSEIYNFAVNQTDLGRTAHPIVLTGLEPEIVTFNKSNRLFHYLSAQIDKLVKVHHIDNKKIVILSNRSFENSIFNSVESIGNYHLITSDKEVQNNSICFKTIHLYKGMESDIVFLVIHQRQEELERNTQYLSNELIYVGCTRAKHLLHVIYFNPIFAGCQ